MKGLVALLLVVVGAQACARRACSDVGGINGITVTIPKSLDVRTGAVALQVCDPDGCRSATQRLARVPEQPVGRSAVITYGDLGRPFQGGPVQVTATLTRGDGEVMAVSRRDVLLTRHYPNGKACDGDGYLSGQLRMTAEDRVSR